MQQMRKLRIFYDGLCPVCSKEIELYRRHPLSTRLQFVDIAESQFDAESEGLNPETVQQKFHVKKDGQIIQGVDAFVEIWKTLEMWKALQWAATSKLTRPFFELGYWGFTKVRPFLRKKNCDTGVCESPRSFKEIS